MTIQVVSGGQLLAVDQSMPPTPLGGGMATLNVPFLPHVLADRNRANRRILDAEYVYRTQPAVRKVVDYLVQRFTRVPLKGYIRESDTERQPLPAGDLAGLLRMPWPNTPQSRFLGELLRDRLLWDRWAVMPVRLQDGSLALRRLPPQRWQPIVDGFGDPVGIWMGNGLRIDRQQLVMWYGRDGGWASPMEAIFTTLSELIEASKYREQMFARTGRFPAYISRPDSKWSDQAYNRFSGDFADKFAGDGPNAGELPVLEDGMKVETVQAFSPADQQYLEGVTLGEIQVCGFYHLAPELIGARPGNYSNMDAFRQGLYAETLGSHYVSFQDEFNTQLVPAVETDQRAYLEFMMEAVLMGSFLEQATAYATSTGAPWLLRSEARAMQNRPPVAGMDEPVVPLNVLVGGLASPRSTVPLPKGLRFGAKLLEDGTKMRHPAIGMARDHLAGALSEFFHRQGDTIVKQLGASKDIAPALDWDSEQWDDELSRVLLSASPLIASAAAKDVVDSFDPTYDWSDDPMFYWLRAAATNTAKRTNQNTFDRLTKASVDPNWEDAVQAIFAATAIEGRSSALAQSVTTETASFGGMEAAKAVGARQKKWSVHSANPRASHAAIDGETVGLHEAFSNGLRWPGDHLGGPDETMGCTCSMDYIGG